MIIAHLVTHSGGFHADELLSSVILTRLFPQAQIMRTRDTDWRTPAPDRVIHAAFDADFVLPIDLVDNGALWLPLLLESLKPVFDDRTLEADDLAFDQALVIARAFVEAAIARKAAKLRAEAVVMDAIAAAGDSPMLELPMGMPLRAAIDNAGADHLLFVVHPRDTDWAITGIRRDAKGFALRADLPAAWAGLTDAAFEAGSGVPGARFCHNACFIAVAADRRAALQLAALAVQDAGAVQQAG